VRILTHTEVLGFDTAGNASPACVTSRAPSRPERVVNAAGAWSPEIARMLGVELPNKPHRHEICSTEPLKPWLKPLVADLSNGLYFSQSMRGEIVGGISTRRAPRARHGLVDDLPRPLRPALLVRACPMLGAVKVLRQWAGCYDLTPDANPHRGRGRRGGGFFQCSGFMGHGFMMAPVMGRLMAQHVAKGTHLPMFERWALRRFREGRLRSERMIIG
jgi:sarcosine oxidase subunit beta